MAAVDRGRRGLREGEFRPAEAHLDRLGLSKGGRGIPPPLPLSLPAADLILPRGTLFPRPPPPPRFALESAQRERRTCTCIRDSTRAYMWHGEGLLWRPTLGTGVKRHWPARGLDRSSRTCA